MDNNSVPIYRLVQFLIIIFGQQHTLWCTISNCNIHVERKISFMNKMKWYEIWPRKKVECGKS